MTVKQCRYAKNLSIYELAARLNMSAEESGIY